MNYSDPIVVSIDSCDHYLSDNESANQGDLTNKEHGITHTTMNTISLNSPPGAGKKARIDSETKNVSGRRTSACRTKR